MENVLRFAIMISAVFIVVILIELIVKMCESCSRKARNFKITEDLPLSNKRKIFFENLCRREEVIYRSYLLYNALYFVSSFLSLEYSIVTTATLLIDAESVLGEIWIPLITLTFTVLSISVKPQNRANQYLLAWRKYDAHTQLALQQNFETMSDDAVLDEIKKSVQFQSVIERSLKHDLTENC